VVLQVKTVLFYLQIFISSISLHIESWDSVLLRIKKHLKVQQISTLRIRDKREREGTNLVVGDVVLCIDHQCLFPWQ
jgi:hypothetical protein